jgi:signal transduction histidine kinase
LRTLVLRIYLALLAVLLLFAVAGGALVKMQFERERESAQRQLLERLAPWAEFAQALLPDAGRPPAEQAAALEEIARRWRSASALDDAGGARVVTSAAFQRREADLRERLDRYDRDDLEEALARNVLRVALPDGRSLLIWRGRSWRHGPGDRDPGAADPAVAGPRTDGPGALPPPWRWPVPTAGWSLGPAGGLLVLLALLFVAVAAAAWPVARRLTRRLETLQRGVEAFGDGHLQQRVAVEGRDEVSALARSFNQAAGRIESLVASNRSLLANASHEIRSPLARLKMAVSMLEQMPPGAPDADGRRQRLQREIHADIAELDALVDEVLLASRLEARPDLEAVAGVDLGALVRDESSRLPPREGFALEVVAVPSQGPVVEGDERLLRRAVRNLLENARRYGGDGARVTLDVGPGQPAGSSRDGDPALALVEFVVEDRGPGVAAEWRERIFEPFFRVPGHAERDGGVGLGLALVRQIAARHGGQVRCEPGADGRGSRFVLTLPARSGLPAR